MSDSWVTNKNSDPYKQVLLFDLMEGYIIGYFDIHTNSYYDMNNVLVGYVAGWQDLPERLNTKSTIQRNLSMCSYRPRVEAIERSRDE